ncbi:MAG: demethoxyubiquinone hydroxylase family protein [Alphaproteobacteria bacterium]|nr:demethoxyubiquinone hydroxylase family protein [Alphaproteobacteria bacterium]MBU1525926.1 demethoxyubiquinone hydroxylase family protein [Alphaproteobacteria bacterium]MBU2117300.1 demethoxyubiquinone hydroxylase family protein [Alphaproteobacteria bacterium]MBU2351625.1 demethoxyubiquinone hydroxylase family protein [Alphaproteobacteria bacterium]MBU2383780.1 demethoxyubiquinone hydroxylase family protein [Alphaproteobacteria bacterium]
MPPEADPAPPPLPRPGPGEPHRRLAEILRVDHAGEYAAVHIYRAQRAVFEARRGKSGVAADLTEMEAHERVHLSRFETLLTEKRVAPTALLPIWRLAAGALGAGTALLGEKAAHACTEAVESVIEKHYASQIAELSGRDPELAAELKQFRDDELAHHDHAVASGSREAPAHRLLSEVIKAGCRTAIRLSERV